MRLRTTALACALVLSAAPSVTAQSQPGDSLTPLQTAVACAAPPVLANEPADAIRIVGSQDTVERGTFGMPEVLVLNSGTNRNIKVDTLYFVRRVHRTAETLHDKLAHTVQTGGWVRVVAANEKMALVSPVHTCGDLRAGDYLEPFVAPVVMEGSAGTPLVQGELNFDAYARVLHGDVERQSVGSNEFATLDHGFDRNIRVGTRFAIYRDLKLAQNPLKRIGEAIAVSVGPSMTLVRVTTTRDAVFGGDIMVPRTLDGVTTEPPPSEAAGGSKGASPSPLSGCQTEGRVPPQNPRCVG
jgi:hypothetical protein